MKQKQINLLFVMLWLTALILRLAGVFNFSYKWLFLPYLIILGIWFFQMGIGFLYTFMRNKIGKQ